MEDTRSRWERAYLEALDHDSWGQVEEAIEGYQRLQVAAAAEYVENVLQLPMSRREGIGKLAAVLKLRIQELQTRDKNVGLNGMKSLKNFLKQLIVSDGAFPIQGIHPDAILQVKPTPDPVQTPQAVQQHHEPVDVPLPPNMGGTLRAHPQARPGDLTLSIYIEKWGLKDAEAYVEPQVAVIVCDGQGKQVEVTQETPHAKGVMQQYVYFENTVHIQTPLNQLPEGFAVFLEFRHWKASKKKKSVKAYSFMEVDEIRSGPLTLEVYKKPADYKRSKKPALLSVKPLYLHLQLRVERN